MYYRHNRDLWRWLWKKYPEWVLLAIVLVGWAYMLCGDRK